MRSEHSKRARLPKKVLPDCCKGCLATKARERAKVVCLKLACLEVQNRLLVVRLEERVRLLDRDGADHIMQLGFTKVQDCTGHHQPEAPGYLRSGAVVCAHAGGHHQTEASSHPGRGFSPTWPCEKDRLCHSRAEFCSLAAREMVLN